MRLIFSLPFEEDFAELVTVFSEAAGDHVGIHFEREVCRLTKLLLKHPHIGRLRQDLKPDGIRSYIVPKFRNYLLFYQIKGSDLILLRIRYGGMDLPTLFG